MLNFIVFLVYAAFFVPLIKTAFMSCKKEEEGRKKWRFAIWMVIGGTVGLTIALLALDIWTEVLWFDALGYASVFWKKFGWRWLILLSFSLGSFIFLKLNALAVKRSSPPIPKDYKPWYNRDWRTDTKIANWTSNISFALVSLFVMGLWARSCWEQILMYFNQVAVNISDPIFGKDVGFYLFSLPVYHFLSTWLLVLLFLSFFAVILLFCFYASRTESITDEEEKAKVTKKALKHLSFLGAGIVAVLCWKTVLAIWKLLYSGRGVVFGASYADVHAQVGAYKFFIVILLAVGVSLIFNAYRQRWKAKMWTFMGVGLFSAWLLVVVVYPALIQQFAVKPNELDKEIPYIEHNIRFTRQAFQLDKAEERNFAASTTLTMADIEKNRLTIENVRVWDWRALKDTYKQIQGIRPYYEFDDVDVDRYRINGKYRQVMLAPRELPVAQLPEGSKTWVNERLKYTHGFGICLNTVNEFTAEGLPRLLVKDMPPVSSVPEIEVKYPQIYYGEMTEEHIFVKTLTEEFDYPKGDKNAYTTYQGQGGVRIGSWLRKLAFALRFDGVKILLSRYIKPDSRVIFHRQIEERVRTLAPFLVYDKDPYIVIDEDGKLWWLWDAYTVSGNYPYAERRRGINYIRNSVKVTIDALNGSVSFYIFDETDPLIQVWQKIFPDLFKPKQQMPPDLQKHVRYPEDFLSLQAEMYGIYHMQDPQVFYNKEDMWVFANELYTDKVQSILPYYVIVRLPHEEKEEFIQMIPFTPIKKDNLIGWMAGRCDGKNYGKLLVYKLPKEKLIYGPAQIEARIDQEPDISEKLTLWGQMGSTVIRANLLVIPIESSFVYEEPLYIQAEQAKMPELKKVIVAYGERLTWADSFEEGLSRLLAEGQISSRTGGKEKTASPEEMIGVAAQHFRRYLELTGKGKIAEAGKELEALATILNLKGFKKR